MKHKILLRKLKENGWNMQFDAREQALIKDIAEITEKESIPIEPPVSPMLAEEKTKKAFTDIHQILSNSKYGMNDCVATDKIYKVLNNLQQ